MNKKPISKSRERNRRVQFNMHIGQAVEEALPAQQSIPQLASSATFSSEVDRENYAESYEAPSYGRDPAIEL
jgi:hypothetical protein